MLTLSVAFAGASAMVTGVMLTAAVADFVLSACEVAVTVTVFGLGAEAGAVYKPAAVIDPHAPPVQPRPETLHVTD